MKGTAQSASSLMGRILIQGIQDKREIAKRLHGECYCAQKPRVGEEFQYYSDCETLYSQSQSIRLSAKDKTAEERVALQKGSNSLYSGIRQKQEASRAIRRSGAGYRTEQE
jgi:hypothetical protein